MKSARHGNSYMAFVDLMALEKLDETTYRSTALAFSPSGSGRAYGGHVYAQAVWAAAKTVESGLVIHVSVSKRGKKSI
jgi:acyl-CoA thioesterase